MLVTKLLIWQMLEAPTCLHAVGQGALAVECRFEMMMMMPGMVTVAVEILSLNDAVERGLQVVNILWNICQKSANDVLILIVVVMMTLKGQ